MHKNMFVNEIGMTQACWGRLALFTLTEHLFTSLSEETLHYSSTAKDYYGSCLPFGGSKGADFLFIDDNARLHRNADVSNTLEREDINFMQ